MRIGLKLAFVLALTLAILVPLAMVRGVIGERQAYRAQAVADVVASYAGPQAIAGPVLTVPYTETVEVEETDGAGRPVTVRRRQDGRWTFFPARLDVSGTLVPTVRRRGIYEVNLFAWTGRVDADFDVVLPEAAAGAEREIGRPWLGYAIADVRGLRGSPRVLVGGREVDVLEGEGVREGSGIHLRLAPPAEGGRLRLSTRLSLQLAGAESLAVVPLGKRNRIALKSPWPHPSFQGVSPMRSRVSAQGFEAEWQVASVATDVQRQALSGARVQPLGRGHGARHDATGGGLDALGVVLADPVDAYTQADRATKYGLLFVLLTFVGFFMLEVIRSLRIHPIQYGLVGMALAIFFLLLVSLSEHVRFGIAYAVASAACIGLIGFYLAAVLRRAVRAAGFSAMLALLYAALYGLLVSEDNALVLGSGLLFVVLAAIMVATRRLDWYQAAARFGARSP